MSIKRFLLQCRTVIHCDAILTHQSKCWGFAKSVIKRNCFDFSRFYFIGIRKDAWLLFFMASFLTRSCALCLRFITARKRSLGKGNMFTGVCLSTGGLVWRVCSGGGCLVWFLLFPDRENTGNFAVTQGKILRHRENILF